MNFWQIKDYLVKNLNKNIIKRKEKEKNTTLLSIVKNFVSGYKGPRISLRFPAKTIVFSIVFPKFDSENLLKQDCLNCIMSLNT